MRTRDEGIGAHVKESDGGRGSHGQEASLSVGIGWIERGVGVRARSNAALGSGLARRGGIGSGEPNSIQYRGVRLRIGRAQFQTSSYSPIPWYWNCNSRYQYQAHPNNRI